MKTPSGYEQAAKPAYRLQLTIPTSRSSISQPAAARPGCRGLNGQLMGRGDTRLTVSLQAAGGQADMDVTAQIEGADLLR